jgi:cell division septal protein FtsQ
MKERTSKIYGLFLFLILFGAILYMVLIASENKSDKKYERIEISGANLLSEEDYTLYTNLSDTTQFEHLTLAMVKEKFEKHPYINKAEVKFDGTRTIQVRLDEKTLKAVVTNGKSLKLVDEEFKLLPLIDKTSFHELPIISNVRLNVNDKNNLNTDDASQAISVIEALKIIDEEIYKNLAEVNLNNGGDVVLTFTGMLSPVIFGRGNVASKVATIKTIWREALSKKDYIINSSYIDLRYKNKIFIGKRTTSELNG